MKSRQCDPHLWFNRSRLHCDWSIIDYLRKIDNFFKSKEKHQFNSDLVICLHQEIVGTRILTLVCPNIISFTTRQSMAEEEKTRNLIIFLHLFIVTSKVVQSSFLYKLVSIIYRSLSHFDLKEGRPWGKQIYGHKFSPLRKSRLYFILRNKRAK